MKRASVKDKKIPGQINMQLKVAQFFLNIKTKETKK